MIVIKLGGSLTTSGTLLHCLNKIEFNYPKSNLVLVPGGGLFADQVRLAQQHWQFNETIAHEMALLAMQQMALLFNGLKPNFVIEHATANILQQSKKQITIWSPDIIELNQSGIPASWDITSDSLAAWLARKLRASELILVKSAIIDPTLSITELIAQNTVDKAFDRFTKQAPFKITITHATTF